MRGIRGDMSPFGKYGDLLRRPNGRPAGTQGIPQMQSTRGTLGGGGLSSMGGTLGGVDQEARRRAREQAMAGRPPGGGMPGGIERMDRLQPPAGLIGKMPEGQIPGMDIGMPLSGGQSQYGDLQRTMQPPSFEQFKEQQRRLQSATPGGGGLGLGGRPPMMQPAMQEMMRRRGFGGGGFGGGRQW